ncbi:hypothetical protein ACLOJK_019570 [Asimina triloba]
MGQLDSLAVFDAECCETAFSARGHAAVTVGICIRWLLDWVASTHSRWCRPIGIFHGRRICFCPLPSEIAGGLDRSGCVTEICLPCSRCCPSLESDDAGHGHSA